MAWETWVKMKFKLGIFPDTLISCIILAVLLHNSIPEVHSNEISKREKILIQLIEDHALTLDPEKFYFDPIMLQEKSFSVYTDPKKKKGKDLIFRKRNPDSGKDAIALSSEENKFAIPTPRGGKKRQFVLLRKSPNIGTSVEGTPYFGSFVFVRQHLQNDSSKHVFDIRGVQNVVEWDIWETRSQGFFAGWGTCEFTTLFTCESLQEMLATADKQADMAKDKEPKKNGKSRRRRYARRMKRAHQNKTITEVPKGLTPIVSEPGYDPNDYNDLYLDLDFHRVEDMVVGLVATKKGGNDGKMGRRKKRSLPNPGDDGGMGANHRRSKRWFSSKPKPTPAPPNSGNDGAKGRNAGGGGGSAQGGASVQGGASAQGGASVNAKGGIGGMLGGFVNKFSRGENVLKKLHSGIGGAVSGVVQGATKLLDFDGDPLAMLGGAAGLVDLVGSIARPDTLIDALTGDLGLGDLGLDGLLSGDLTGDLLGGLNPVKAIADVGLGLKGLAAIGGGIAGSAGGLLGGNVNAGLSLGPLSIGGSLGGNLGGNLGASLGGLAGGLGGIVGGLTSGLGGLDVLTGRLGQLGSVVGLDGLDAVGGLGAVVGGLNNLMGGNLMDVGVDGLATVIAGISDGTHGPASIVGSLINGGLGSGASIKALLGPAGGVFDMVNTQVKGLASGLSGGNLLASLSGGGADILTDSIGAVVSSVMSGTGDLKPLDMAQQVLGPIVTSLDPVNAIVVTSNAIVGGLPSVGRSMGHHVTSGLASITDSLSVGGLLSTVGLGPVQELVPGLHDTVAAIGESLLSPHNIMGRGVINGATEALVKLGLPEEIAQLAALGAQLTFVQDAILEKGFGLSVRQISQIAGISLNGGAFRASGSGVGSSGFQSWQKMMNMAGQPSTAQVMHAVAYPGAGVREFYIPLGSIIRAKFFPMANETDATDAIEGSYEAGFNPGQFDMFTPDEPSKVAALQGKRGVIVLESYKQPHRDAKHGILGALERSNWFVPESVPKQAVFNLQGKQNTSHYWLPPGLEERKKTHKRPERTADNKPMIYGHLFHGIRESPHIFVAEGDSLSGFFVPHDAQHSEQTETPHGVLYPGYLGGHAQFILDDENEFQNVKEISGVFMPDAMNLAGGTGGKLFRPEGMDDFSFVMDHPMVDFVYIKNHPRMANVWAAFLSKEEWKYTPPAVPPPKGSGGAKTGATKSSGLLGLGIGAKAEAPSIFGIKINTQKTECFLPENKPIDGITVLVNKNGKLPPVKASLVAGKLNAEWKMELVGNTPTEPMVALFIPTGYPAGDALVGAYASGQFKLTEKQKQEEHFYNDKEQIWVPQVLLGLLGKLGGGSAPTDAPVAKANAVTEDPTSSAAGQSSEMEKAPNYYFGPGFETSPEMEENVFKELPREFEHGVYFIDEASPEPLFVPEAGGAGTFTPDQGGPQNGVFVPGKGGQGSSFTLDTPGSIPDGTAGKFNTINKAKQPSKGFVKATLKGSTLEIPSTVEVIPGWHYATTQGPATKPDTARKPLTYHLAGVGGGFQGVVVPGPQALEDPNNPIFQEFLHYKAHQDGSVNPWGNALVFDPVNREAGDGQTQGDLQSVEQSAPKSGRKLLDAFTFNLWEYPVARGGKSLKMGNRGNLVNMLDFRMYIIRKYACKRVEVGDKKWINMLTPFAAEPYLTIKEPAQPKPEWIAMLPRDKDSIVMPRCEGIVGFYAQQNKLPVKDLKQFAKKNGNADPMGMMVSMAASAAGIDGDKEGWTEAAPFTEWGDKQACDEIVLDEVAASQATEQHSLTGVELGLQLMKGVGNKVTFPEVASKLLANVDMKTNQQPPGGVLQKLGTTDLLGGIGSALTGSLLERKHANVEANSGEATGKEGKKQRRKRQADKKNANEGPQNAKNIPGWKTQFKSESLKDNATFSHNGVIFYGLGNCEQKEPPPIALFDSKEPAKVIQYYLKVLRIDCMANAEERIMNLFNEGFLVFGESRDIFEVASNPVVNQARLKPMEMRKLSIAFELSAFSKTYQRMRAAKFPTEGFVVEPNCKISRSVSFLTELSLYYVHKARRVSPSHSVRLTRNVLKTLRTVLTKLHQDTLALAQKCPDQGCKMDKMITEGDKFRTVSLIEFIIHGMGPYHKGTKELKPAFYDFVKLNEQAIKERVAEFGRQFPHPRRA